MSIFKRTALTVALLAAAPLASAATDTSDMQVSITIENACTITAQPLSFGTSNDVDTAIDGATTITLDCTAIDTSAEITFNEGTGAGATYDSRKMTDSVSGATIDYGLYIDSARTDFAGDGTSGSALVTDSDGNTGSTGEVQTFDLYGRVFGSQGPKPAGTYTDTVVATVTY